MDPSTVEAHDSRDLGSSHRRPYRFRDKPVARCIGSVPCNSTPPDMTPLALLSSPHSPQCWIDGGEGVVGKVQGKCSGRIGRLLVRTSSTNFQPGRHRSKECMKALPYKQASKRINSKEKATSRPITPDPRSSSPSSSSTLVHSQSPILDPDPDSPPIQYTSSEQFLEQKGTSRRAAKKGLSGEQYRHM